jgi:tRNA-splicing ligase RtcB
MRVPVQIRCPDEAAVPEATLDRLRLLARVAGAQCHVAALPDLSWKPRNDGPTGVVLATAGTLAPQALDGEPNCGMRLMVADIAADDLDEGAIEAFARGLAARIPTCTWQRKVISHELLEDILCRGAGAVVDHWGLDPSELDRMQDRGNHFADEPITRREVRRAVPSWLIREFTRSRLGSLGTGNHFIELRRVDRLLEPAAAERLGLRQGQLAMMMHSGSTGLGVYVSHFYGPRPNVDTHVTVFCHWSRLASLRWGLEARFGWYRLHNPRVSPRTLYEYDADSAAGRRYLTALRMASNFAYANRTYLAHQVRRQLRETLGRSDLGLKLICCLPHVSLRQEEHFGRPLWVHRHGATRAFPAERLPEGHPFKATGEPALIPGSLGSDAYLGVAHSQNADTFHSVNHGSGVAETKKTAAPGAGETQEAFARRMFQQHHVRVFKGDFLDTVKADPSSYRDIEASRDVVSREHMVRPVCSMSPILSFKE